MTDDLVRRLLGRFLLEESSLCREAADRIEELEAALFFVWWSKTLFDAQEKARTVLKGEQK